MYIVMIWEAPEKVILHFLDLAPNGHVLNERQMLRLLRSPKYLSEFCRKLMQRCQSTTIDLQTEFEVHRLNQAT